MKIPGIQTFDFFAIFQISLLVNRCAFLRKNLFVVRNHYSQGSVSFNPEEM